MYSLPQLSPPRPAALGAQADPARNAWGWPGTATGETAPSMWAAAGQDPRDCGRRQQSCHASLGSQQGLGALWKSELIR